MLVIRGNKRIIQQIFIDHSELFHKKYGVRIRSSITWNIEKVISCGTKAAGYHMYQCPNCKDEKIVPHTCKSRFCSSCGVKATDLWVERYTTLFPECKYQHLTFSPPHEFLDYFQNGREDYFNALYQAAYLAIMDYCRLRGYRPGVMSVMHTFGRARQVSVVNENFNN
jgi:hypothetical protein